jgi:hypothetical protein
MTYPNPQPRITFLSQDEIRRRINTLCYFYPALLGMKCGERRLARAARLIYSVKSYCPPFQYIVNSEHETRKYLVDVGEKTCECLDSISGNICKHRIAVAVFTIAPDLMYKLQTETLDHESVFRGLFMPEVVHYYE